MSYAPPRSGLSADQALDQLEALYDAAVDALRQAVSDFISHGTLPDEQARAAGLFVYPELRVSWDGQQSGPNKTRAFGRFTHPGSYSTTVTRPQLFRHYLAEQLAMLEHDYAAHIEVAPSQQEIPFPYVIDGSSLALDRSMSAGIAQHFPTTELAQIGDETADGLYHTTDNHFPLSHFDALRADFSLARLRHYTGTPVEHFQPFVLFTNYTRYVDEFVRWACAQIADPASPYIALSSVGFAEGDLRRTHRLDSHKRQVPGAAVQVGKHLARRVIGDQFEHHAQLLGQRGGQLHRSALRFTAGPGLRQHRIAVVDRRAQHALRGQIVEYRGGNRLHTSS